MKKNNIRKKKKMSFSRSTIDLNRFKMKQFKKVYNKNYIKKLLLICCEIYIYFIFFYIMDEEDIEVFIYI